MKKIGNELETSIESIKKIVPNTKKFVYTNTIYTNNIYTKTVKF